jgi:hypothetical protein
MHDFKPNNNKILNIKKTPKFEKKIGVYLVYILFYFISLK